MSPVLPVEQLVRRFYATADAEERTALDSELTRLQRHREGFAIADRLLQSEYPEVRLYGANTFIVKIKHDLQTLDGSQQRELQARLLEWLRSSMQTADRQPAMAKKFCSAVVECFIASNGSWSECVPDALSLFIRWDGVSSSESNDFVQSMTDTDRLGVVWFTATLVEMVAAREPDFASTDVLRRLIDRDLAKLVFAVSSVFSAGLDKEPSGDEPSQLTTEALLCLGSLIMWTRDSTSRAEAIQLLRPIISWVIKSMAGSAYSEIASATVYEVMMDYPNFLTKDNWDAIASVLLSDWALGLLRGAEFDETGPMAVAKMTLAYCETRWEHLCAADNTENDRRILECCLLTLNGTGVPNVDDQVASLAVDLWTLLVEELQLEEQPTWPEITRRLIPAAIRSVRVRAVLPSADRLSGFTQTDFDCFASFRSSAGDFIESVTRLIDMDKVSSLFTSDLRQALLSETWPDVEADLFCLNSIISKGGYENYGDVLPIVGPLFYPVNESPFLNELLLNHSSRVPLSVRKAVTSFYVNCKEILEANQFLLSSSLSCLFVWLQEPEDEVKLKLASAIFALCSRARSSLISSGPWLCSELESYATKNQHRDLAAFEKLFGAVSAIAQAATTEEWGAALEMIKRLLSLVQYDVDLCLELTASDSRLAREHGRAALKCLANMGMAFRVPAVEVIDNEDDESSEATMPWALNRGITSEIGAKIMSLCSSVYGRFHGSEELEAMCNILKAGYTEEGPGPFVFPLSDTLALLQKTSLAHTGIGEVLNNCLILLQRYRRKKSEEVHQLALRCLQHIASQLDAVFGGEPSQEPEVAALLVDFIRSYLPDYVDELMGEDTLRDQVFDFSVKCFRSHEILPKKAAAQFWSVYLGSQSIADSTGHLVIGTHGKQLTMAVAEQSCGGASRGELECVSDVLRAIVRRGGEFRGWLREAVASVHIESASISADQKRMFVEQVLGLRGVPRTRKVLDEFWALCQGTFVPAA